MRGVQSAMGLTKARPGRGGPDEAPEAFVKIPGVSVSGAYLNAARRPSRV